MLVGDYVIANDILGVVYKFDNNNQDVVCLRNEEGKEFWVNKTSVVEIASGYALAALIYEKLKGRVRNEKSKDRR